MMKIEELSIGDWVRISQIKEPVEITKIHYEGCMSYVICSRENTTIRCYVKHIQPIPPFIEVLEGIGFIKEDLSSRYICSLDESDELRLIAVGAGFASHMLYQRYLGDGEWNTIAQCTCHSVHEIQHFITLAHIDKEIKL